MFKVLSVALAVAVLTVSGTAAATIDPKTNQASYWGDNCKKTEMNGEVMTYSVTDPGVTKVVVKGGTGYKVYNQAPFTNLKAPLNSKNGKNYAISHVIVCTTGNVQGDNTEKPEKPTDPSKPQEQPKGEGAGSVEDKTDGEGEGTLPATTELPKTGSGDMAKIGAIAGLVGISGYLASARRLAKQSA